MRNILRLLLVAAVLLLTACGENANKKFTHGEISLDYDNMSLSDLILLADVIVKNDTLCDSDYDSEWDVEWVDKESQHPLFSFLYDELYGVDLVPNLYDEYFNSYDQARKFRNICDAFTMTSRYYYEDEPFDVLKPEVDAYLAAMGRYIDYDQTYPVEKFRSILISANLEYAYMYNHGAGSLPVIISLKSLVEAGLYKVRTIRDVADMCTDDGKAGIFQIPSIYNNEYSQTVIMFESDKGIHINLWDINAEYEHNYFTKVFHINENGKDYYLFFRDDSYFLDLRLFVYEDDGDGADFQEVTFGETGFGNMLFDVPWIEEHSGEDFKIIYNPREYKWNYCYFDGQYWQQIPETETLRLVFGKGKPELVLE